MGNWHPLTTLSFMLDAELFGDWWGGYHLHNALLHAAASAFLFAALTRLTGVIGRSLVAAVCPGASELCGGAALQKHARDAAGSGSTSRLVAAAADGGI